PFRNAGGTWTAESSWTPPDPGSGPAGVAVVARGSSVAPPPPPPPGSGNHAPTAHLTASPQSGAPPLRVLLDAAGSDDPDGDALAFTWDVRDGGGSAAQRT